MEYRSRQLDAQTTMQLVGSPRCATALAGQGNGQDYLPRRSTRLHVVPTSSNCSSIPPPPIISKASRRNALAASSLLALLPLVPSPSNAISSELEVGGAILEMELKRYTDQAQGFTLLVPSSWIKVEKAGATALFEEGRGNSIGVVVYPVRIKSLSQFGTSQFVADKILQAERKKESTKAVEMVSARKRSGHGGLPVYEIEYMLDSSRGGMKRIFTAAFVASKKLYLLNITHSDSPEKPLDSKTRVVLEQVLHSFDMYS